MAPYIFYGKILPERAPISLNFELVFSHLTSGNTGKAKISILLNQLIATVYVEKEWDVFDLRNVVRNIVQGNLSMVGYLKGYAYDLEITRVLNLDLEVDYVFGIDIPCIAKFRESIDLVNELEKLRAKNIGGNGIFLDRCFNDLISSMKHADDTGFYCYRAIEALRHHCAAINNLSDEDRKIQWKKFREVSNVDEQTIRKLETSAKLVRHGGISEVTNQNREDLFKITWDIVDSYIANI